MSHTRIYTFSGSVEVYNYSQPVISMGAGASGTYHFVMELLVGLAGVSQELIDSAYILVPQKTSYILSWLNLFGVPSNRIIDNGHVFAETLIVPEMGLCGRTWYEQHLWISEKVKNLLKENSLMESPSQPLTIVLVERTKSRASPNFGAVKKLVEEFAEENGYKLIIHSDRKLPTLIEQLHYFSEANIMISTHGAAQLFINFLPKNACVLDFSGHGDPWSIYAHTAYLMNVRT